MPAIAEQHLYTENKACLRVAALGCFDGVHIGHASLIREAKALAGRLGLSAAAVSFEVPPAMIMHPGSEKLITDTAERSAIFEKMGLDASFFLSFEAVKDMSAADFINGLLIKELGVAAVVCGSNFTFGKGRSGTAETLKEFFGDKAIICPTVESDGYTVSSTRIRALISGGEIEKANGLLSFPLSYTGYGRTGRGDGSRIGFPTANIFPPDLKIVPSPGVYVSKVTVPDGGTFPAVTDAGYAPTLDKSGTYRLEAHILDYSSDLHGKEIKVTLLSRIRCEKHFDTVDELMSAIESDINKARAYFAGRENKL